MRLARLLIVPALAITVPVGVAAARDLGGVVVRPGTLSGAVIERPPAAGVVTPESTKAGSLVVVAPPEAAPVANQPGVWAIIPGLSTNVYSRAGDDLEITITAEMYSTAPVEVRALVDLVPAEPGSVFFKTGGEEFDGARSFTFVIRNVTQGPHMIEMLWFTERGKKARIRDRSLAVHSASPTSGDTRLHVRAGDPAIREMITTVDRYADIPQLEARFRTDAPGAVAVTFSAEAHADKGRLFARAVVDEKELSDVLFAEAGNGGRRGARSHTFVLPNLAAGEHTARVQWRAEGGQVRLGGRTMTVQVSPATTPGGGLVALGRQMAPTVVSTEGFVDVPTLSADFSTTAPSTSASISFGGEVLIPSGRLFIRALVDGKPASPGDVTLIQGGPKWRASSFAFTAKNLLPGAHSVRFQAAVDKGKQARIGDRFLKVVHKRRSGAEFSQTYRELQPTTGIFASLVICFDPMRDGHLPPSFTYLKAMMEGMDGGKSARGWFAETTKGRVRAGAFAYEGCSDGAWHLAPASRRGNWYWDNKRFDLMWEDAIKAADKNIDFRAFDRNRDNKLTPEELTLIIVRPQNDPYGTNRKIRVAVDGKSDKLEFTVIDVYLSSLTTKREANGTNTDVRRWAVGLVSHELAHFAVQAWDLHSCTSATRPSHFSIMDEHSLGTHLDPFHKLKLGHVTADLVELTPLPAREVTLRPVETDAEVIVAYSPKNGDREYFVIENRWPGPPTAPNYDGGLMNAFGAGPTGGVVVWHLFQDLELAQRYKPPGGESCSEGRNSVRKLRVLVNPGDAVDLVWADGTKANVQVKLVDRANPQSARVSLR